MQAFLPTAKMIQRIQSVFLLLLALCMLSMLALPLWHKADALTHQELTLTAFNFTAVGLALPTVPVPVWVVAGLALVVAAVAVYEIFQFRRRFSQLKLGLMNVLLITATFGTEFYLSNHGEAFLNPKLEGQNQPAFYLPLLALALNLLASRFIRRDEQLVRSADRLR